MTETNIKNKKKIAAVVVSTKMKDTAVVKVERYTKHSKYGKFIKSTKKYSVHDQDNTAKAGDKVMIQESKPISKTKKFKIVK